MYAEHAIIPIKSSASLLYNNFDVLPASSENVELFTVVHKSNAWVFNPDEVQNNHNAYKRILCKGETVQNNTMVMQAKWCVLPQRKLLVVASLKGIQMFDLDGYVMIFWATLTASEDSTVAIEKFRRGITAVGSRHICVGTSNGNILVYEIPVKGNGVKLTDTLEFHTCSINDLHATADTMASTDDSGKIVVWKAGGVFKKIMEIQGYGSPCTSVRISEHFIAAGYGSGHLRLFDTKSGAEKVKVAAHAGWINAIDLSENGEVVLSTSEDTYVRVWKINEFELLFQKNVENVQLTGGRFLDKDGNTFGVTGYDSTDVQIFKKN